MGLVGGLGPLSERDYRLLWLGQAASALGSSLVPIAVAFAVLDLTGSASALGLVLTAAFVPRGLLLPLGGVVAHRLPRQRVMLVADASRALTQGAVGVLLLTGTARVWHLAVLFALYGAGDAFFAPASTGLVPETVGPDRLQQANALMSMSLSTASIAGPVVSGVLVATAGPGVVLLFDAGTFVVSAVALAFLRLPVATARARRGRVVVDLRDGWRELTARTWVWASIVYFGISNLAIAPLYVLGPLVAERNLGGAAAWGVILTCAGIGSVLGDATALRLRPRRSLATGYLALAAWGLAPALLAVAAPTAVVAASAAIGFATLSFSNALWFTALQTRVPRQSLSRVSSYDWLGSRLLQPAGYALAGPVGASIGIPATLLAGAGIHAVASL